MFRHKVLPKPYISNDGSKIAVRRLRGLPLSLWRHRSNTEFRSLRMSQESVSSAVVGRLAGQHRALENSQGTSTVLQLASKPTRISKPSMNPLTLNRVIGTVS